MSILHRNNINITGVASPTMLMAHGFGCDQNMWRSIVPAFKDDFRVVLFDHVGSGKSDLSQYRSDKYGTLQGYSDDVLEIIKAVNGAPVTFVGHSVGAMIGVLAAIKQPGAFRCLILVAPSPCYINDDDYVGGFTRTDIESLLETLEANYLGWSRVMAPIIMSNPDRPELGDELTESFCRTDPEIARQFAQVTFLSDSRRHLGTVTTPALILQCSEDVIAPESVGRHIHQQISGSTFMKLQATGHCPHLSSPGETITAIKQYLGQPWN